MNITGKKKHIRRRKCKLAIILRIREDQKGDQQLEMFEDNEYMYRVFATNMPGRPHKVIVTYDKRASIEVMIKEAQQEGILAIASRRFLSNHAYFQIVMLSYNMWCPIPKE